jgi:hypothetical protein
MVKKIIINLIIVVAIVFLLDFAIGRTLRYFYFKQTSGLQFRTTYAMEKANADVLIFGSSRASHHYVPEVFEDSLKLSYYNTGRDGNGIFYQTAVLKSVLKRYTPKVIIFDFAGGFETDISDYDRMSSLLPYYRSHEEIRKIIELKSPFEKVKLLSQIYPYNSSLLTIIIGNLDANKNRKPDNKGYVALYKEWKGTLDTITDQANVSIDSNKVASFKEFISYAKKSGAKVFIVYSPIYRVFNFNQQIEMCNSICLEEHIPFYDYSKDTTFLNNKNLFQDFSHLNHPGAIIFSSSVVEKIKADINKNIP